MAASLISLAAGYTLADDAAAAMAVDTTLILIAISGVVTYRRQKQK